MDYGQVFDVVRLGLTKQQLALAFLFKTGRAEALDDVPASNVVSFPRPPLIRWSKTMQDERRFQWHFGAT